MWDLKGKMCLFIINDYLYDILFALIFIFYLILIINLDVFC